MAALQQSMQAVIPGQSMMIPRSMRRSNIKMNLKIRSKGLVGRVLALDHRSSSSSSSSSSDGGAGSVNYVVPMDQGSSFSCITSRPLVEILRDLNKRIPDNIILNSKPGYAPPPPPINSDSDSPPPTTDSPPTFISWYHANRMLSFYAPGWCGEIRDVIFSDAGRVTVVYRVTIRGSDGEAHRESTGTVLAGNTLGVDPVAAAEELAFCRACARFGLGLYLYHEE